MSDRIKINQIAPGSGQEIVDFFYIDFAKNEPMCQALGGIDSRALDFWVHETAVSGLSFEAIDTLQGNKRVGVYLCTTYKNGEINPIDIELGKMEIDEKFHTLIDCLDDLHMHLRPQIFADFNVDEYLEGVNLSVLPEYGGQGIAAKLTEAMENRARELNIPLVYVCCSSEYTSKVCAKRGFKLFHTQSFDDYLIDGQKVFHTKPPHVALKCYAKFVN